MITMGNPFTENGFFSIILINVNGIVITRYLSIGKDVIATNHPCKGCFIANS